MLEALKEQVCAANVQLVREGLVIQTWGNASGIDRQRGLVVIKPSGVAYDGMQPCHMVTVDLETGRVVEGDLKPSSDTATHLELYRAFPGIGGVVHTHSLYATAWAQARQEIPCLGTTQADYFCGSVPCTRLLRAEEIRDAYEAHTGRVIVETFSQLNPAQMPGVLVAGHGPFTWGKDAADAVHHAVVLEYLARLASETLRISQAANPIPPELLDKHFCRKHGDGAYYGQNQAKG